MEINFAELAGCFFGGTLCLWLMATIQLEIKAKKQKKQVEAILKVLPPLVSFHGQESGFTAEGENTFIRYTYGSVVKLNY